MREKVVSWYHPANSGTVALRAFVQTAHRHCLISLLSDIPEAKKKHSLMNPILIKEAEAV